MSLIEGKIHAVKGGLWVIWEDINQWHSHGGVKGGRVPTLTSKNCQKKLGKRGKNQEKEGKKEENGEEKAKIRKVLSLCPSWQRGLTMLLTLILVWFHWDGMGFQERCMQNFCWSELYGVTGRGTGPEQNFISWEPRLNNTTISLQDSYISNYWVCFTWGHTPLNGFPILYCTKWHPKLLRFLSYKATIFFFNSWISLKIMILGNLWGGKNK